MEVNNIIVLAIVIIVSLAFNELPRLVSSIKPTPDAENKIIIVNETGKHIEDISNDNSKIILVTKNNKSVEQTSH